MKKTPIVVGILVGMLVLALAGKALHSFQERSAWSEAWVSTIEERYRAQIERLRSAASTATNSDDRWPAIVANGRQPVREDDWRLFGAPEILEAKIQFQPQGWRILSKQGFHFSRGEGRAGFSREPRLGSAIMKETTYWDQDQKRVETIEYLGVIRHQNGELRQYSLLFDRSRMGEAAAEAQKKKPGVR